MTITDIDPADLLTQVYDVPYDAITAAIIEAMVRGGTSGIIARRLDELLAEAERLAEAGDDLTADNPYVVALLADVETQLRADSALIISVADDLVLAGVLAGITLVQALSLPGVSEADLAALGWVTLDAAQLAAALGYVESDAFAALLAEYVSGTLEQIKSIAITGIAQGQHPLATARALMAAVQGLPPSSAQQIMRTLQLVSSRDSQLAARMANEAILEYQIRIAALDARTCMSCVALHGQILPIDARIDDHHNGRCTSVTKVVGFPAPDVQSGADWFASLPQDQQIAMMGRAAWQAWQAGVIRLDQFPREYDDDVFGRMIGEQSLVGILGDRAEEFK